MGMQIARRLHKKGHQVVAWNRSPEPRVAFSRFGGQTTETISQLVSQLKRPRIVWSMVLANKDRFAKGAKGVDATEEILLGKNGLIKNLSPGDIVIDGSNSYYEDTIRRSKLFVKKGVSFFDAGTSGGIHGEKQGFALMVGGEKKHWKRVEPIFKDLAAARSYGLVGPSGAGHFVKMVHNGIEYGMMEAIAEGYALINKWNPKVDLAQVTKIWQQGSVVRSWLIDLILDILQKEDFSKVVGLVRMLGEGEWSVLTGKHLGVDVRVMEDAVRVRRESEQQKNQKLLRNKLLALMRNRFGGHEVIRRR